MTVTSDFRPEVEIWPFRRCAMKNMHYKPYSMNSSVIVDSDMWQIPYVSQNVFLVSICSSLPLESTS